MGTDTMVRLEGMEFRAFHGCLDSERTEGNRFRVDVAYDYDLSAAAISDDIADAVDYSAIYGIVKREMGRRANLLEKVACRIAEAIKKDFPKILSGSVTVTKFNPPVGGPVESSSVTIDF